MSAKVKICGITCLSDALAIAKIGVDYLGFIVEYSKSPRSMSLANLREIVPFVKSKFPNVRCVGVFVDAKPEFVKKSVKDCGFDIIQLHGDEDFEYCRSLNGIAEIWKAIVVGGPADVEKAETYRSVVDKVLFDAGRGSGKRIDLDLLQGVKVDIIAGGLKPDDYDEISRLLKPEICDFNSGVELEPGVKDLRLIEELVSYRLS